LAPRDEGFAIKDSGLEIRDQGLGISDCATIDAVPAAVLVCILAFASAQVPECADAAACRLAAEDAAGRGDYETFHDLAWRAAQKGRPNDPALMTLVARAQSLSGRPGDALVMLRRLAQIGAAVDAATSDDFRRVRALPGWPEVEAMLAGRAIPAPAVDKVPEAVPAPMPPAAAVKEAAKAPVREARAPEEEALPDLLASIQPAGLAYDAVSRRFIVGDRRENKLVIFDDVFKRATDMIGAESAGFFGVAAVEIDARRGDLWVANSSAVRGASLHKLQLVSGRLLFELAVPAELGPTVFADAAVLGDGRVLLLDTAGRRLLATTLAGRAFQRIAGVDVEAATSVAAVRGTVAYVAHREGVLRIDLASRAAVPVPDAPARLLRIRADGAALIAVQNAGDGQRILRIRLNAAGTKVTGVDVLDGAAAMLDPSGMTVADGVVCYIVSAQSVPTIRRIRATK
jgi:hypothetical protein